MSAIVRQCEIVNINRQNNIIDITVRHPKMATLCTPGQFLHIHCNMGENPVYLRRPISICEADDNAGTIRFIFEIRGAGTENLSTAQIGDTLDILGPLGKGFAVPKSGKVVLVGGGIGIFPLLWCAKILGERAIVLLGYRSADYAVLQDEFSAAGYDVRISSDDGSIGHKGFVTDLLADLGDVDGIMTCGPKIMMRKCADFAAARGISCWVSMEERMACGFGVCLGCATKSKRPDESETYTHVCKHGPVYEARDIIW